MAQRLILIDDLDESEGAQRFYDVLGPYIEKSRRVQRQVAPTSRRGDRRRSSGSGRDDIPQIRAWAQSQGMDVSERGRVKKDIIDAYDQAHQ
jgi:hypothetical protein